ESADFRGPRDDVESALASIFAAVLRLPHVDIGDGFFDIGGHSLLATQVVSRVRQTLPIDLPLQALVQAPAVQPPPPHRAPPPAPPDPTRGPPPTATLPLSFAQERLWFLDQLEPDNPFYNVPVALRVRGALDVGVLERSLQSVLERHHVLRARFAAVDGRPAEIIRPAAEAIVGLADGAIDLSALDAAERMARVHALAVEETRPPFDLPPDLLLPP